MQLRKDWKRVALRAWSLRFNLAAVVFGGAEVAVNILSSQPPLPRGTFAAIAAFVSVGAALARLFAQREITPSEAQP